MIRAATAADAAALGTLKVRAWRAAYAAFMPTGSLAALDPSAEAAAWADYLAVMPTTHPLWVADHRGVLGFCRTGPTHDPDLGGQAAEIYGLYIEPDRIGTGPGRALFGHAVADLDTRGFRPVCGYAYTPTAARSGSTSGPGSRWMVPPDSTSTTASASARCGLSSKGGRVPP